jgi:hypothetical protein
VGEEGGGGGGAKSNDGVKAWFSLSHSMLSGLSERSQKLTMIDLKMTRKTILNTADNGISIQVVPLS